MHRLWYLPKTFQAGHQTLAFASGPSSVVLASSVKRTCLKSTFVYFSVNEMRFFLWVSYKCCLKMGFNSCPFHSRHCIWFFWTSTYCQKWIRWCYLVPCWLVGVFYAFHEGKYFFLVPSLFQSVAYWHSASTWKKQRFSCPFLAI